MEARVPLGRYEFHLSFGDVEREIDVKAFKATNRYSVHLPDYVSPTLLMDPFSPSEDQRAMSLRVLERTVDFTKRLQDLTGAEVPVVGSFSVVHKKLAEFFSKHAALLDRYREQGVSIMPQWLPPIAWYFGGAVRLEAMNNVADVEYIKLLKLPICMDICHLLMGDKVFDFDAADVVRDLAPYTGHVHIADALGYDGEGVAFGEGEPENRAAIQAALDMDCVKVIEVWQGHLNGGAGGRLVASEVVGVDRVNRCEVAHVGEEDGDLDRIGQLAPSSPRNGLEVFQRLDRLGLDSTWH